MQKLDRTSWSTGRNYAEIVIADKVTEALFKLPGYTLLDNGRRMTNQSIRNSETCELNGFNKNHNNQAQGKTQKLEEQLEAFEYPDKGEARQPLLCWRTHLRPFLNVNWSTLKFKSCLHSWNTCIDIHVDYETFKLVHHRRLLEKRKDKKSVFLASITEKLWLWFISYSFRHRYEAVRSKATTLQAWIIFICIFLRITNVSIVESKHHGCVGVFPMWASMQ